MYAGQRAVIGRIKMKTLRKMYCRTFQLIMYMGSFALPWRQPALLEGENAILDLPKLVAGHEKAFPMGSALAVECPLLRVRPVLS